MEKFVINLEIRTLKTSRQLKNEVVRIDKYMQAPGRSNLLGFMRGVIAPK